MQVPVNLLVLNVVDSLFRAVSQLEKLVSCENPELNSIRRGMQFEI